MNHISQLDYEHITYKTNITDPTSHFAQSGTIRRAGCGICCLCMMVAHLTTKGMSIQECVRHAYKTKANLLPGTDMERVGPFIAEHYGLTYKTSNDVYEMMAAIEAGGLVIANVGGDNGDYEGVFSHEGHFVLAADVADDTLRILDPTFSIEKYEEGNRSQKVTLLNGDVYCHYLVLDKDCETRTPRYHIFEK